MRNVADNESSGVFPAKLSSQISRIDKEAKVTPSERKKLNYGPMELMGRRSPLREGRPVTSAGFTLVELLVVIGIISLLVSVLLPALNKARQQANLIDCESRLRQMGQALNIYVTENNGLLPYGDVRHDPGAGNTTPWENPVSDPENQEFSWYWTFTLSKEVQAKITGPDGLVNNLSAMFRDVDTIDAGIYGRFVNHYTCNPRILPDNYETEYYPDGTTVSGQYISQRKLSNIKPSSVFLFWDAPQCLDWDPGVPNNAYEQAIEIDGNAITASNLLFLGTPNQKYGRPVAPGGPLHAANASQGVLLQKKYNIDLSPGSVPSALGPDYFVSHLRFRHMGNSVLNALCVDGHVENRTVGTFMDLDICIKPPG
jgi:prepilin-type N-terminal cleavage/methylation domain-containing protein